MMLKRLMKKKELYILGINSGTSADGIDLALIRFRPGRTRPLVSFVTGAVVPYPRKIKSSLEGIIQAEAVGKGELGRMDVAYGHFLGQAARRFIDTAKHRVDLIASHGQTIGHFPRKELTLGRRTGTTLQIGDGNAIAVDAQLPVISDFRQADIALGGEGAPLTPFVNQVLFGDRHKSRIIVNIGGIANYSVHPAGASFDRVAGGDCGPGNVLSDLACRLLFHKAYDRDGHYANKGESYDDLVAPIVEANKHRGISAGREQYDQYLLAKIVHISRRVGANKHDILTSIDEAAARLIHRSIASFLKDESLDGVFLTGGGRRNPAIVARLQKHCGRVRVWPVEALGYNGDFLEAISFAVLGGCAVHEMPSTMPRITGGKDGGVAGKLSLPPGVKRGFLSP